MDTVIVDEIHALVPTKRGVHLMLSLERLAAFAAAPPQRIGLSATQRPLDEVARFLAGAEASRPQSAASSRRARAGKRISGKRPLSAERRAPAATLDQEFSAHRTIRYRPVTIVDAGQKKLLALSIQVPVEDMARLTTADEIPSGPLSVGDTRPSIWAAIHPRLLELIRTHRSTLIFVNSRRLAERLAGALNELAGEILVRSHHGSIAREQRVEVEDLLKSGSLRALVATSSLELGIDMGAIDLVVQIEAPPSVASGLQRIGRGGHQVNAVSKGVIFPKFRGDLVACAAVARAMHDGDVEATRYPRNPLDIVAQQIVAMTSMDTWDADELFATIRRAAPFAELSRGVYDGVLDMLSGRYPSDEFAELRPRITWDRLAGTISRTRGRQACGRHQRRNDSRPRPLRRLPGRRRPRRRARRRAGRGNGLREPPGRDLRPRRILVEDRGDHARPGPGVAGAGRTREDAVLEGRPRGPPARVRPGDWKADAGPAAPAAGRGASNA